MEPEKKKPRLEERVRLRPVLDGELTEEPPTVEVIVGTIADKRLISKTILSINEKMPVPDLQHLKRVKGNDILVCKSDGRSPDTIKEDLISNGLLVEDLRTVRVASKAPLTRKQYSEAHRLWPCNFHANKYIENLVMGAVFSEEQIEKHISFMNLAFEVAQMYKRTRGCLVVDPAIDSIVAIGVDLKDDHPCQHASLIAIDNVARSQHGGMWDVPILRNLTSKPIFNENGLLMNGIPESFEKKHPELKMGAAPTLKKSDSSEASGPYLCTNYYVYLTNEPCVMCSMALVHSRVKRVFYAHADPERGALGSKCKLHTTKALNHHYEVFTGFL